MILSEELVTFFGYLDSFCNIFYSLMEKVFHISEIFCSLNENLLKSFKWRSLIASILPLFLFLFFFSNFHVILSVSSISHFNLRLRDKDYKVARGSECTNEAYE